MCIRDRLNPYTVLGTQIQGEGKGRRVIVIPSTRPAQGDILVDPAGLPFIQQNTPNKAYSGAASGAIYRFLSICRKGGFPARVVDQVRAVGHACGHAYPFEGGRIGVVHAVGPDFREGAADTLEHNAEMLANAYFHLFVEVAGLCAGGDFGQNIRVPPVSSG
eukprot:6528666-Alexandrium_andersonii.AAC.1